MGSYAPNTLGLYDMMGNVHEWVQDKYKSDYQSAAVHNPLYEGSGIFRVKRGGGWFTRKRELRCSGRDKSIPGRRSASLGFRLVRVQ